MTPRHARLTALCAGIATLVLAGCPAGSPSTPVPNSASPSAGTPVRAAAAIDADACEHFDKGPIKAVVASDTSAATAPLVSTPHTRFDVTLPGASSHQGFTRFSVSKAGDYIVYLNKAMDLTVLTDGRTPVTAKESAGSSASCGTARLRRVYPLTVGTYYLQFGPTSEPSVSFVSIAADDQGDE